MEYDQDKIDEVVLALLYLHAHDEVRAWKGHDWDTLDNLHAKGYISNPATSDKSVVFTKEGWVATATVRKAFRQEVIDLSPMIAGRDENGPVRV